jgi:hypothetical protein
MHLALDDQSLAVVRGVQTARATSEDQLVLVVGDRLLGAAVLQVDHQDHDISVFVEHCARSLREAYFECNHTKFI